MGTNFYIKGFNREEHELEDVNYHIGKRSAAGLYCWKCNRTMCKEGEEGIHHGMEFHEICPTCGNKRRDDGWNNTAGLELGFAKVSDIKKEGLGTCSSFTWTMKPEKAARLIEQAKDVAVIDEYGREYTAEQFTEVLNACPIRFYEMIGKMFS